MVFILPRLRGTFILEDYTVKYRHDLPANSFFRPNGVRARVQTPLSGFLLEKKGEKAIISQHIPPNLSTPSCVTISPRTRETDETHTLIIRTSGANSGRDCMKCRLEDGNWRVMRAGSWLDDPVTNPLQSGWSLTVRPCGSDFARLSVPNQIAFAEHMANTPDPIGGEKVPPCLRRGWIALQAREFFSSTRYTPYFLRFLAYKYEPYL